VAARAGSFYEADGFSKQLVFLREGAPLVASLKGHGRAKLSESTVQVSRCRGDPGGTEGPDVIDGPLMGGPLGNGTPCSKNIALKKNPKAAPALAPFVHLGERKIVPELGNARALRGGEAWARPSPVSPRVAALDGRGLLVLDEP